MEAIIAGNIEEMNKSSNTLMVQIDQSNEQLKEIRKPRKQCMVGPENEAGLH
jgi:hypothetical protein